jgi:biotin carboxyl carrier protein
MESVIVEGVVHIDLGGRSTTFRLASPPDVDHAAQAALAHGSAAGGPTQHTAPMPGAVLAVHVRPGEIVELGDPLITLEAMKMEHIVQATSAGRVADVMVGVADQVSRGQSLVVIDS